MNVKQSALQEKTEQTRIEIGQDRLKLGVNDLTKKELKDNFISFLFSLLPSLAKLFIVWRRSRSRSKWLQYHPMPFRRGGED